MKKNHTQFRLSQVTKRLDHMVPDDKISVAKNSKASKDLLELTRRLHELIPDPSLSPDERLERLARVVQDRVPLFEHLQPANTKLHKINGRLNELVPGKGNALAKINKLVDLVNKSAKQKGMSKTSSLKDEGQSIVKKLEFLGDGRAGFDPIS